MVYHLFLCFANTREELDGTKVSNKAVAFILGNWHNYRMCPNSRKMANIPNLVVYLQQESYPFFRPIIHNFILKYNSVATHGWSLGMFLKSTFQFFFCKGNVEVSIVIIVLSGPFPLFDGPWVLMEDTSWKCLAKLFAISSARSKYSLDSYAKYFR